MPKRHRLQEVNARSGCGIEIVVEQIFENIAQTPVPDQTTNLWSPLAKVVITDTVIDLDFNNSFTHPRTGKTFQIVS